MIDQQHIKLQKHTQKKIDFYRSKKFRKCLNNNSKKKTKKTQSIESRQIYKNIFFKIKTFQGIFGKQFSFNNDRFAMHTKKFHEKSFGKHFFSK